jgi:signal peptidase I
MPKAEPRAWLSDCIINGIVLLFGFAMVAQPYVIPSGSMENNLLVGDHLIVDKLAYAPAGSFTGHL